MKSSLLTGLIIINLILNYFVSVAQPSLAGHYKIAAWSRADRIKFFFKNIRYSIKGSELYLNSDSTFKYISCGNILKGEWQAGKNAVLLKATSNEYRSDSLIATGKKPAVPKVPLVYQLDRERLYRIETDADGKMIELFSKEKE